MRKLTGFLLVGVLLLAGCSQSTHTSPINNSSVATNDTPVSRVSVAGISPGIVWIGNFYPGARAEWNLSVRNGDGVITEQQRITTGENDTNVTLALRSRILYDSLSNVKQLTSNLTADELLITGYNPTTRHITISGLAENSTRLMSITYLGYTTFAVTYRIPDYVAAGYAMPPVEAKSWVIITDNSPVLVPYEIRDILVALDVPVNAVITTDKWEFWISVKEANQGNMITELCSKWLVAMQ